jgi:GNAT superfamily N-acetyltransferase
MSKAMDRRIDWIRNMMNKGLEIYIAIEAPKNDIINYKWAGKIRHSDLAINGKVPMGLLECVPIEHALEPITGKNSLFINCMWILPPFWGRNVAKVLIKTFIERAREIGSASVLTYDKENWFETTIEYMPTDFFKKYGFVETDRDGSRVLLFMDFNGISPPKFIRTVLNSDLNNQKPTVNILCNDQCPWSTFMVKEIQEGIKEIKGSNVKLISTNDREYIEKWGISRGVILNDKPIAKRMVTWNQIKKYFDCFILT